MSNEDIADKLDINAPPVRLCLSKFEKAGIQAALEDSSGHGRPEEIYDDSKLWVIAKSETLTLIRRCMMFLSYISNWRFALMRMAN